ncbi:LysR family transcriptional regulator [Arenibaculum pallidiluteum]|uniref:LysR family transcriptional regulator n=1 Tax=Arenibaculum pallidiluteum TaxID=2812559 RepID=UPI001A959FDA|nr:LysR family transcriptional regulator [Arenibaculum pallidiluteum]
MFVWDDLKHLLAVAQHGSTLAAARVLGVNQSTVQRRLAELERQLGERLVERHPSGYRLTDLGKAMLPHAESIASAAAAFEQHLKEAQRAQAGTVRLTCPEPIAYRLTQSGLLDRFHARHPDLKVEFVLSDRYVDLSKGEADVALRSGDTDDGVLVGRKIADSIWAIYASHAYVAGHGAPSSIEELRTRSLIGFDETLTLHRISTWLREIAPHAEFVARTNSVLGLVSSAKAGVGIAPLPIALGDCEPDLIRVLGPVPELTRAWRLLTHPDQRNSRRVSAFFDFIISELDALKPILTG